MKKYRFKYNALTWVLLAVVLLLGAGGLVWNIFNLTEYAETGEFKIIAYAIMILINVLLIVFDLSVMFFGYYKIEGTSVICRFGIIKTVYDVNAVTEITHFKKSDKLVMYFKDATYTVIVIAKTEYEDFILSLRKINKEIIYDARIEGEDNPF